MFLGWAFLGSVAVLCYQDKWHEAMEFLILAKLCFMHADVEKQLNKAER